MWHTLRDPVIIFFPRWFGKCQFSGVNMNWSRTGLPIYNWKLLMVNCQLCLLLVLANALGKESGSGNWTTWRGPSGQGHVDDTRVPLTWSDKENLLWSTDLPGKGNSTPIIWGNRIFLTAASNKGDERYVICVDRNDGKILWKQLASRGIPPGRTHGWNGYASASCTTDGERVYAF